MAPGINLTTFTAHLVEIHFISLLFLDIREVFVSAVMTFPVLSRPAVSVTLQSNSQSPLEWAGLVK